MAATHWLSHGTFVLLTACGGLSVDHVGDSTNGGLTTAGSSSGAGGFYSTGGGASTPTAAGGSVLGTGGATSIPAAGGSDSVIPVPSSGGHASGGRANGGSARGGTPGRGPGSAGSATSSSGDTSSAGAGAGSPTHYVLAGLTSDREVVAAYWTGTEEAVVLVDPQTGRRTNIGTLGDLYLWSSQFIYDDASRMAYAVGQDSARQSNVYSFSLDDRQTTEAPLAGFDSGNIVLGGVTASGSIIAATWVGPPEALVQIDPASGKSETVGSIDGLTDWNAELVYDDATRTTYAIGHADSRDDNYVFTSSLDSGETTRVVLEPNANGAVYYTLGGLDSDANLVAALWDGSNELLVALDPTTATTKVVGYFDGLEQWDNELVYSEPLRTVVAYGFGAGSRDAGEWYPVVLDR